jgi:hypothetical protein
MTTTKDTFVINFKEMNRADIWELMGIFFIVVCSIFMLLSLMFYGLVYFHVIKPINILALDITNPNRRKSGQIKRNEFKMGKSFLSLSQDSIIGSKVAIEDDAASPVISTCEMCTETDLITPRPLMR